MHGRSDFVGSKKPPTLSSTRNRRHRRLTTELSERLGSAIAAIGFSFGSLDGQRRQRWPVCCRRRHGCDSRWTEPRPPMKTFQCRPPSTLCDQHQTALPPTSGLPSSSLTEFDGGVDWFPRPGSLGGGGGEAFRTEPFLFEDRRSTWPMIGYLWASNKTRAVLLARINDKVQR